VDNEIRKGFEDIIGADYLISEEEIGKVAEKGTSVAYKKAWLRNLQAYRSACVFRVEGTREVEQMRNIMHRFLNIA
jgi:hypothetical protein